MAYKSLYRKYRPTKFDDVCGQQQIVNTLCNAIENGKIGHAYLFTGTRGTGKTTIAKIFAKKVNCLNKNSDEPCQNSCKICSCENTDEIPDIIEIDAASNNGVDEIRELKNKIKLMPVMCRYKVYIIDEVHMLSTGAFNALLKTLEEPPEHVIFVLATTEPQKLPITIISRCQRFDFKKISIEDIKCRLDFIAKEEKISITEDALKEIAKISDGAMRDAIGMLDQLSAYCDDEISIEDIYALKGSVSSDTLLKLADLYISNDAEQMLNLIEDIYNRGKSFYLLTEDMLILFRNILICKKANKYFNEKKIGNSEKIKILSTKICDNDVKNIINKLEDLAKNIKDSNYSRVLFEVTMLSSFKNIEQEEQKQTLEVKKINENNESVKEKIVEKSKNDNGTINNNIDIVKKIDSQLLNTYVIDNKDILINNTIFQATAQNKKAVKEAFFDLDKYLINKKYKIAASILKDATVQAASSNHLLLTYKYSSMVEEHYENLNIQNLINKILKTEYKVVAISESEWIEKRPQYLELKKKGEIKLLEEAINDVKENIDIKEKNDSANNYIDMFGSELIEMEG